LASIIEATRKSKQRARPGLPDQTVKLAADSGSHCIHASKTIWSGRITGIFLSQTGATSRLIASPAATPMSRGAPAACPPSGASAA